MCANLWTNEDKQLRIPRVMPSVFFAIAKPLLFVIDSFLPVLINHLDCSLSNSLQMGNGLAGKHLSGPQGPNSSQNGKPALMPGCATQTRNHSLSKTLQDSTPILPLKRRRQGLEETLHSHALPTPGGDARRKLLPAFHGAGAPTTGACLGHERQKLETFCCTSRQIVEVLVLPPLIISRGTTTISCGYSSMALLRPQVTARSKAPGHTTPRRHPHICWPPPAVPAAGAVLRTVHQVLLSPPFSTSGLKPAALARAANTTEDDDAFWCGHRRMDTCEHDHRTCRQCRHRVGRPGPCQPR